MALTNVALSLRRYLSMTLVAVACTIAMICGPANAADPKVTIFSGIDEHWVPLPVAKAKGFFTAEGVDAEVTVFTTGATATEAFALVVEISFRQVTYRLLRCGKPAT
jgi:ABC-type nitrate/sulfonate/bicarbonate transport system substrate-binding protein